jgi:hypothetical protein
MNSYCHNIAVRGAVPTDSPLKESAEKFIESSEKESPVVGSNKLI